MGHAVDRDLVQALVMVPVDHLVLAVANRSQSRSGGRAAYSSDYDDTIADGDARDGPGRIRLPDGRTVIGSGRMSNRPSVRSSRGLFRQSA
jgi:hypothetical protein